MAYLKSNFSNANGITFGTQSSSNGNVITASYTTPTQTLQPAVGLNTAQTNVTWTVNSSGISFNAGGYAGTGFATTTTNGSVVVGTNATNGFTMAVPPYLTTAQAPGAYLTTAALSNHSHNFATTTTNGASIIVATTNSNGATIAVPAFLTTAQPVGAYLTTARASNDAIGLNTALTANGVSVTANSSGLSLNFPAFLTTAQPVGAYLTTARASNDAIGLNTAGTNVTWTVNSSGLSFNGAGYAGTGTSATNASVTLNSNGLAISVAAPGGGGAINVSAGTTSGNLQTIEFANSNGVSFGLNGSTITASAAGGAGGGIALANSQTTYTSGTAQFVEFGALTIASTTGQKYNFSVPQTSSIVGTGQVSVSTNGSTISIGVPNPYIMSYENLPGIFGSQTMTLNGASISHAVAFQVPENATFSFLRLPVLMTLQASNLASIASATATGQAGNFATWNAVVYSMGAGASSKSLISVAKGQGLMTYSNQISISNSTQASHTVGFSAFSEGGNLTVTTQYSISNTVYSLSTNMFSNFSSNRMLDIPFNASLSPGAYWLVLGYSSSSSTAGAAGLSNMSANYIKYSNHYGASQPNLTFGLFNQTNRTSGGFLGAGSFSTAGGGTTSAFNISAISTSASHVKPYFQLLMSN